MAATKSTPKDAQVMAAILKDQGITEHEPRVVNQMLEFTYRYVTGILDDAKVLSNHAKKKSIDLEDVKLAIQLQMDKYFTTPPPHDILVELARQRNNIPLPLIKPHCGLRLPPDRYCMSAPNFKFRNPKKVPTRSMPMGGISSLSGNKMNLSNIQNIGTKLSPAVNLPGKSGISLSLVSRGVATPTVTMVTRPSVMSSTMSMSTATAPTPTVKIVEAGQTSGSTGSVITKTEPGTQAMVVNGSPAAGDVTSGLKRKREEDDYDAQ